MVNGAIEAPSRPLSAATVHGVVPLTAHIQAAGLRALSALAQCKCAPAVAAAGGPAAVSHAMLSLPAEEYQCVGVAGLAAVAAGDASCRGSLHHSPALRVAAQVMRSHPENAALMRDACTVIGGASSVAHAALLVEAMQTHPAHQGLVKAALSALVDVAATGPSGIHTIYNAGALPAVSGAMAAHPRAEPIQRFGCMVLAHVLSFSAASADVEVETPTSRMWTHLRSSWHGFATEWHGGFARHAGPSDAQLGGRGRGAPPYGGQRSGGTNTLAEG